MERRSIVRYLELGIRCSRKALACFLLGSVAGAGCSSSDPEPPLPPAISDGGTLRILHEDVENFDPVLVDDVYEGAITNQIFEGLVRADEELGLTSGLAQSWTISEDGQTYRFQLRRGVRFHNGEAFDAESVVRTFERVLDPTKPSACLAETYLLEIVGAEAFRSGASDKIDGVRVLNPFQVEIELQHPLSFFLSVLAMDQLRIVPNQAGEQWFTRGATPIGTGPFRMGNKAHRGTAKTLSLHRNPDYWGREARLDSVVFVSYPSTDSKLRIGSLAQGTVDVAWVEPESVDGLLAAGFRIETAPELTVSFLGVQANVPPLDDRRIRRAIAHCVDRSPFLATGFRDVVLAEGILPPGLHGPRAGRRILEHDLAEAARLVADAGYGPDHPTPPVTLYTSSSGRSLPWFQGEFAENLRSIGIPLQIEVVTWRELDGHILEGTAPLFLLGWVADVPDPDGFLFQLFHSQQPNNLFGYANAEVDAQLVRAREMSPGAERRQLYAAVERAILADGAMVPLYHEVLFYAWNPAVRGASLGPYGLALLPMAEVWIDPNRPVPEWTAEGGTAP